MNYKIFSPAVSPARWYAAGRLIIGFSLIIAALFGAMLFIKGGAWLVSQFRQPRPENNPVALVNPFSRWWQKPAANTPAPASVRVVSEESAVIEVVKKAAPAVVSIIASAEVPKLEQCYRRAPGFSDLPPEFQQFFDFEVPSVCQRGTEKRRVGAGSGFLVSANGFIVTNKHVVAEEAAEYTVVLNDAKHLGTKVKARVLARDPNNDIAILRIDLPDDPLPWLAFGDSGALQVGQTAIAIGYALGEFDNTVSKGVVSGLSRTIQAGDGRAGVADLRGLIQTDAAINPGNSGGPLLDIAGKVIGISVAMANAQSIGFAVPASVARAAFLQARDTGVIKAAERAFLGVRYLPITSELAAANKLPYDYGMLVSRGEKPEDLAIMPGSPANKAGIIENDIILEIDGQQLNERRLLSDVLNEKKPGDEVSLKIYHQGEVKTVRVKLAKR